MRIDSRSFLTIFCAALIICCSTLAVNRSLSFQNFTELSSTEESGRPCEDRDALGDIEKGRWRKRGGHTPERKLAKAVLEHHVSGYTQTEHNEMEYQGVILFITGFCHLAYVTCFFHLLLSLAAVT